MRSEGCALKEGKEGSVESSKLSRASKQPPVGLPPSPRDLRRHSTENRGDPSELARLLPNVGARG